jgi:hypothetical protein
LALLRPDRRHWVIHTISCWFMMQIAMLVGFLTSYLANWWLVRSGVKEKM